MSAVRAETAHTRPMRRADIGAIARIETASYPFPWSIGIFRDCLLTGYYCRVLDSPDGIVGYAVMAVGAGEAHILNLCVHPDHRRGQLGQQLLAHLTAAARRRQASRIFLEVRPSNIAAQRLYERAGFSRIGVRPNYYPSEKGREDALVLSRAIEPD